VTSQLAITTPQGGAPTLLPSSGRLILGSSKDRADIVFGAQGVADVHCVIAKTKDGGWAIQDMGSEFGTMLDGKPIEVARLRAGQTILIASVSIKVVEVGKAQEEDAPVVPRNIKAKESAAPAPTPAKPTKPQEPTAKAATSHILDIPGYSIQETLGKGGMGAVFRARQDRLNRDVALKVLSPRLAADADFVRRFHKEAQAVAALNHPNIVTVYDVGEASGTHFIAMEYMDDNSLEELLAKEGRLPWRRVAEMLLGAARGLTYAESRRIVHRDIKPSNLMLNSDDQVKISDLGLAHRDNEDTGDGRVFGTPHFIAPEQIRGELVDRRCDIYSLGATGYQLLTGYTPFEGVNSREILRAVLTEDFEPIEAHISETPQALSDLIERMIARDPEERPQSAESVATNLQDILSGAGAVNGAGASSAGASSSKTAFLAVALAMTLGATGYLLTRGEEEPVEPSGVAAEDETETPERASGSSDEPTEDSETDVTPVPTVTDTPEEDDTAQKLFESEAEVEFLRMESSELTLDERRIKLLALAEKYNGTTAAAKALAQAQINSALIEEEQAAAQSLIANRQNVIDELNKAAALAVTPTLPAKALAAMLAVPGQDALATDEEFTNARALLRDKVCLQALNECTALFDEAKQNLTNPDQQLVKQGLQTLVDRLQLPTTPALNKPAGYEELRRLEADARALLSDLDGQRALANSSLAVADGATVASYCHSGAEDGLRSHIRSLKLGVAASTLRELEVNVRSSERKAQIDQLATELETASAALQTLIGSYGEWKRKTVTDPRPRRSSEDAIAINADGVTLNSNAGAQLIEWELFSANPDSLNKLFFKRLSREWSTDERLGIATIINFSATLNAFDAATKAFTDPGALKAKKLAALIEDLDLSDDWAEGADCIDQNRAAVKAIFNSLAFASESEWGAAEASLRFTSKEYAGSLFILLLSDGSPPRDPEPATTPSETPGPPELPADTPSLPPAPEEE
jgi:serine/threonine protein kinase